MNKLSRAAIAGAVALSAATAPFAAAQTYNVGEVTALIPAASTSDEADELLDGKSGDIDFPYVGNIKALATIGEVDPASGNVLTGYPDGQAAWLANENTVRIVYQSESYGTMSNQTYPWPMQTGATFTGSHIHAIDYDREGLADFLKNDASASTIFKGSSHLFDRTFNVFGEEVVPRSQGGLWGNQVTPDRQFVDYAPNRQLTEADFFFQSFCGAYYEWPNKYGPGIGFADHIWLHGEEWNIQRMFTTASDSIVFDTNQTMGLASMVVDIANKTAYTAPALGQTGYEKLLPINPQHPDYVVIVAAGYNHGLEPAPLKIYIGRKGFGADGKPLPANAPERDQFLARNGLLYGKLYGVALANEEFARLGISEISTSSMMMDDYMTNPDAPDNFPVAFVSTSYRWEGWDKGVAVGQTEMARWQMAEEQPAGHTFFVGDSKTEHPAVDPDITKTRWAQNMTQKGGILSFDLTNLKAELEAADGDLPMLVTGNAIRTIAAYDGAFMLDVANKGIKHGGGDTHATWEDGRAQTVAPDGLMWIKSSDADVLIVDEDSGNDFGERKFAVVLNPRTLKPVERNKGYFLAMAGGKESPRAAAGVAAYPGTFSRATSSEFSGTWNITSLLARKADGSFYSMGELEGTKQQEVNASFPLSEQILYGVVQHRSESGGAVAAGQADAGGQLFVFNLRLPERASTAVLEMSGPTPTDFAVDPAMPNPFNPSTMIRYRLPSASNVTMKVYNTAGQYVATLADGYYAAGNYAATWDGRSANGELVATGVYIYKVQAGEHSHVGQMTLLK